MVQTPPPPPYSLLQSTSGVIIACEQVEKNPSTVKAHLTPGQPSASISKQPTPPKTRGNPNVPSPFLVHHRTATSAYLQEASLRSQQQNQGNTSVSVLWTRTRARAHPPARSFGLSGNTTTSLRNASASLPPPPLPLRDEHDAAGLLSPPPPP